MTDPGRIARGPLGRIYRAAAVLFFNAALAFLALEVASSLALGLIGHPTFKSLVARVTGRPNDLIADHYRKLPYYLEQPWAAPYWREFRQALKKQYRPYVIWRSPAFEGEYLRIDENGIRRTPGARCGAESYRVYLLGGSAMWGWGAPDAETIAAYLQTGLQALRHEPVCVVNYAEQAYVSTQSLVQLTLLLAADDVPDLVVFYDGVNEVLAASQTGRPILHQNFAETATVFEDARASVGKGLTALRSVTLLRTVLAHLPLPSDESPNRRQAVAPDALAEQVVRTYLANHKSVISLAASYGFEALFFWQPYILAGNKPLTDDERGMITGLDWVFVLDPATRDLFAATYDRIAVEAAGTKGWYSMTDAFDDTEQSVWIDTWGHVTPIGNRIVADRMLSIVRTAIPVE